MIKKNYYKSKLCIENKISTENTNSDSDSDTPPRPESCPRSLVPHLKGAVLGRECTVNIIENKISTENTNSKLVKKIKKIIEYRI